ncbi:phosphotransferase family protein [Halovivax gelatinilyticus]|uniref:phosphotransferase family protein n=1 Tax=Halovivax gelatinilyticus TaxID=2961597 RepID=UPI0020CA6B07|nr:phosphotransferase [Halovivax gelatinilyticus]
MFARPSICEAVTTVYETEASVATVSPIQPGNNHAYHVVLEDDTELLCKVGTRFPEAFPAELKTVERVRRETDVPVPRVFGSGTEPLDYPFTVYEYVPDVGAEWTGDLDPTVAAQLCREAGRYLREIHRLSFDSFGRIGHEGDALSVTGPMPYRELLRRSLDRQLSELRESPFAARCDALDALGTELIAAVDLDRVRPALVHGDYRIDNLRLDPTAEQVTTAVLDWELPTAADPLWDAVMATALLADGYRVDPDARRSLRHAFWESYGGGADGTSRRQCYELLARIRLARHLEPEMRGESDDAVAARIAEHEAAFDALLGDR